MFNVGVRGQNFVSCILMLVKHATTEETALLSVGAFKNFYIWTACI